MHIITRKSSCVKTPEVYRLRRILFMVCPVLGGVTPVLVLGPDWGLPSPILGPDLGTPSPRKILGPATRGTPRKGPGTRNHGILPQERTGDQWAGVPPSPLWTDTHLWKHYLPHPSDTGGNNKTCKQNLWEEDAPVPVSFLFWNTMSVQFTTKLFSFCDVTPNVTVTSYYQSFNKDFKFHFHWCLNDFLTTRNRDM